MTKQELLEEIKLWGEGEPPYSFSYGVCSNIYKYSHREYSIEYLVNIPEYPNFSGDCDYPLIDPDNTNADVTAADMYWNHDDKWDKGTAYGQERRKFCLWIYEEGMRNLIEENADV